MGKGSKNLQKLVENEKKVNWYKEPFVVEGWHWILSFLEKISVFYFFRVYLANLKNAKGDLCSKDGIILLKEIILSLIFGLFLTMY